MAGPACIAVKPQLACFERLGPAGWAALFEVCRSAQEAGLLVIADGKRGDVPVTAKAYGEALVGSVDTPWGRVTGLGADAFTANPLMGRDSLQPLIDAARDHGAGVFVLVRTSNPGAADIEDLPAPERPLHEGLATVVEEMGQDLIAESGLSSLGAVVGATEPNHLPRLRELMPHATFLLPGVGAQGGDPRTLGPAFRAGLSAGIVTASRSIAGSDDPAAAAEELRRTIWEVSRH
jgi:orotidine-5'-phosphate decarboxylase